MGLAHAPVLTTESDTMTQQGVGAPLGALQLAGAAKGPHVDPLCGAPLLPFEGRAAPMQAVVVRLPIWEQAASRRQLRPQHHCMLSSALQQGCNAAQDARHRA